MHSRQGLRPAARTHRCLHPHLLATPQRASKQGAISIARNQTPRQVAPQCAIAQGPPGQAKTLKKKSAQSQTLAPQRTPLACYRNAGNPHNSTRKIQRLQRGCKMRTAVNSRPHLPPHLAPPPASTRLHQGAPVRSARRRRYTDCSAPQPHGTHHPERPSPGPVTLANLA